MLKYYAISFPFFKKKKFCDFHSIAQQNSEVHFKYEITSFKFLHDSWKKLRNMINSAFFESFKLLFFHATLEDIVSSVDEEECRKSIHAENFLRHEVKLFSPLAFYVFC